MDTDWTTDHTAPQELDGANNVNNVLLPENITRPKSPSDKPGAATMSGITPQSTTAELAGKVPKESQEPSGSSDLPGSFPETPANDAKDFSVNPIPATSGIGNPVNLKPGEKVPDPSSFTGNTVNSAVTLDKESYESSSGAPQIPASVIKQDEPNAKDEGMFSVPEKSKNMIPESSLPMGEGTPSAQDPGVTIQSAGPQSTTAQLAAQVPKEPKGVSGMVQESQKEAGFEPEASGNPEVVKEKSAAESELESKVSEEPATSEEASVPSQGTAIAPTVPDVVQESIAESHQSPEAATSETMVGDKSAVEAELLKGVKKEEGSGEPAPTASAALSETAPTPTATDTTTTDNKGSDLNAPAAAPAETPAIKNAIKQDVDSRDISPMTRGPGTTTQSQPTVTTGVADAAAPSSSKPAAAPESPTTSKNGASGSSAAADKKAKRGSGFFGNLKAKFSHKDKK